MTTTIQSQSQFYLNQNSDLIPLKYQLKHILGEICWRVKISYGDELRLDIGEKIPFYHHKMGNRLKGSWNFGSRCTFWQLEDNHHTILANSDLESSAILQKLKIIEGTTITQFEPHYPDLILTIGFSNLYQLKIIPDLTDTEYQDIPCWELFTPNNQLFTLYPTGQLIIDN